MTPANLLANWSYSQQDWNEYVTIEKKNKKEDNFYFGCGIVIISTLGLVAFRNVTFLFGLLFAIPFAIGIPWLRMRFSYPYLKKNIQNSEVKIYEKFLKINNHTIEFINDQRRLKNIRIIETPSGRHLLEFDVQWLTRKGPTNDEHRVLIPSEKMEEAKEIVRQLS